MGLEVNRNNIINDDINRSILIVDDEQDIVNLIKRSLEVNGTRVCAFTDPFLAVKHFIQRSETTII